MGTSLKETHAEGTATTNQHTWTMATNKDITITNSGEFGSPRVRLAGAGTDDPSGEVQRGTGPGRSGGAGDPCVPYHATASGSKGGGGVGEGKGGGGSGDGKGGGKEGKGKGKGKEKKRDREGDETGKEGNRGEFYGKRGRERGPSASPDSVVGLDGSGGKGREELLAAAESSPVGGTRTPVRTGETGGDEEEVDDTREDIHFVNDSFDNYTWTMESLAKRMEGRTAQLAVHTCIRQLNELRDKIVDRVMVIALHRDEWMEYGGTARERVKRRNKEIRELREEVESLKVRVDDLTSREEEEDRAVSPERDDTAPSVVQEGKGKGKDKDKEEASDSRIAALVRRVVREELAEWRGGARDATLDDRGGREDPTGPPRPAQETRDKDEEAKKGKRRRSKSGRRRKEAPGAGAVVVPPARVQKRTAPPAVPAIIEIRGVGGASYSEALRSLRTKIRPEDLGVEGLIAREVTGGVARVTLQGKGGRERLHKAAAAFRKVVGDTARITCPCPRGEVVVAGFDPSLTREELAAALTVEAGCAPADVTVGRVGRTRGGGGRAWARLPAVSATRLNGGCVQLGWARARVYAVEPRAVQCLRCLGYGHIQSGCVATVIADGESRCHVCAQPGHRAQECRAAPSCGACALRGWEANHRMGGMACATRAAYAVRGRSQTGSGGVVASRAPATESVPKKVDVRTGGDPSGTPPPPSAKVPPSGGPERGLPPEGLDPGEEPMEMGSPPGKDGLDGAPGDRGSG